MKVPTGFLLSLLLPAFAAAETRYFPQIGDGVAAGIRFRTGLMFLNTGTATSIALGFRDESGGPLPLDLGPEMGQGSDFVLSLAPGESKALSTPGEGQLRTGYAFFSTEGSVGGTVLFAGTDLTTGIPLFEAGVPAAPTSNRFTILVDSRGPGNTGLALLRPPGSAGSPDTEEVKVTLRLFNSGFEEIGSTELSLAPGRKTARFVNELFAPPVAETAAEMVGSLQCLSPSAPLAAVTLRQIQIPRPFPAGVPVLTAFPVVEGSADWRLVWSDEFEGTSVDTSKWEHQIGNGSGGWGNRELEYYTSRPENSRVEDGSLIITARKEDYSGFHYTSARMRTMNRGDWTYGRFEIRAKLPRGKGIWPAFWMMPTDSVYGSWAASGEIDIMEYLGHEPNRVHGTLHYGGAWPQNRSSGGSYTLPAGDFTQDFHLFALEWEPGEFRWYVDGVEYQKQTTWFTGTHPFPAPFDQRFHLIVNLAVGGNWPGSPDQSTVFPQDLVIDYVRVYRKDR